MATEQSTVDKITGWASNKYGTGAMSGSSAFATPTGIAAPQGMLGATSAPAAASPAAPTMAAAVAPSGMMGATSSAAPKADVASWYRTTLGRDPDQAGISYWQNAIDNGMKAEDAYNVFRQSASANKENIADGPGNWATANSYTGPQSSDTSSVVDDWYRNTMGRDGSATELATWKQKMAAATNPAAAEQVYAEFVKANQNDITGDFNLADASKISYTIGDEPKPNAIGSNGLTDRVIDKATETVQGQLASILASDSQVLQQARAEGMRTGFDRGMGNSSIAASAGADALIRSATGIATTDSGYYNDAANYNVTADNQLFMYDRDQVNQFKKLEMQLGAEAAARAMQVDLAKMQDATSRWQTTTQAAANWDIANLNNATTKAGQQQQLTVAQMQDATSRYQTEINSANSRYSTDTNYRQTVENNKKTLVNNILNNMELSPDRKAAMLEQLGEGTSARPGVPGTGLAGAVYVIDSVGADLNFGGGSGDGGGGSGGGSGGEGVADLPAFGQPGISNPGAGYVMPTQNGW